MKNIETDVIVIGGGATGLGTARDLTQRGLKTIVIEKDDIASGTTGRNHGLLHSGARYAVKDSHSARECITENKILKKIATHCIEETGGLFVTLQDDDPSYHNKLLDGCRFAGINAIEISIKEALKLEPNLNKNIMSAIRVPDGTIDPFRLCASNMLDIIEMGSQVLTYTAVMGVIKKGNAITGVKCKNINNEEFNVHASMVINAAGTWGQNICGFAGIKLKFFPSKGSLIIIDYRINNIVLNRCRMPSDGDIMVPGDTVSLLGTTSKKIDYKKIDNPVVDDDEIKILLEDGEKLVPGISKARVLRAYSGVRPLVALPGNADGRDISRGIVLIDHEKENDVKGLLTIAGGKLMTYRLMGEMTADMVCKKLNIRKKCKSHRIPLPGSEKKISLNMGFKKFTSISRSVTGSTLDRHGVRVFNILKNDKKNYRTICECEMVTEGELNYACDKLNIKNIIDLRRRTRLGMGPCQGTLCAYRTAGLLNESGKSSPEESLEQMAEFLEERWKGIKPVLWGDGLREAELTYSLYSGMLGLSHIDNKKKSGVKNK